MRCHRSLWFAMDVRHWPCIWPERSLRYAVASFTAVLVSLNAACDDSGIEEHAVPKGVEQLPARPAEPPPASDEPLEVMASRWVVPAGWSADTEPRPMRLATFIVPDESGDVEVAITRFPGRVGGELANINRWRGQMGLVSIEGADLEGTLTRFEAPGFEGYRARIESDAGVMLAAGVYEQASDHTWFVRATVTEPEVADRLEDDLFGFARSMMGPPEEGDG